VLGEDTKPHINDVRECKNDFEISQSDAFAASGFRLASDIFGLTAESGLNLDFSVEENKAQPSAPQVARLTAEPGFNAAEWFRKRN